jgi:hypothetical protein
MRVISRMFWKAIFSRIVFLTFWLDQIKTYRNNLILDLIKTYRIDLIEANADANRNERLNEIESLIKRNELIRIVTVRFEWWQFLKDSLMSRGKITTGIFERVKIEANSYPFEDEAHHVISRLASCILQFVRLDRWRSLIRFLHYSYYHWSRDHLCSLTTTWQLWARYVTS